MQLMPLFNLIVHLSSIRSQMLNQVVEVHENVRIQELARRSDRHFLFPIAANGANNEKERRTDSQSLNYLFSIKLNSIFTEGQNNSVHVPCQCQSISAMTEIDTKLLRSSFSLFKTNFYLFSSSAIPLQFFLFLLNNLIWNY